MKDIRIILKKLSQSKFRSSFKLNKKDIFVLNSKGKDVIEKHCRDFIVKRLSQINKSELVDGKQTPFRGHPVFTAQHATATCCRKCVKKWYDIPENREFLSDEIDYFVNIIMTWIKNNVDTETIFNE